eukprot:357877-Prorocentrum_minimum.AAC.1
MEGGFRGGFGFSVDSVAAAAAEAAAEAGVAAAAGVAALAAEAGATALEATAWAPGTGLVSLPALLPLEFLVGLDPSGPVGGDASMGL